MEISGSLRSELMDSREVLLEMQVQNVAQQEQVAGQTLMKLQVPGFGRWEKDHEVARIKVIMKGLG